jgi:RNA polymerase sigma factor (sigma-70 family)
VSTNPRANESGAALLQSSGPVLGSRRARHPHPCRNRYCVGNQPAEPDIQLPHPHASACAACRQSCAGKLNPIHSTKPNDAARECFDALYSANLSRLLAYAVRRTATPEDAADAVAETFLIAWRRIDEVPTDHCGTLWLYGTARRVLANQRRSEVRRTQLSDRLRAELEMLAQGSTEARDELDAVRRAMDRMRPEDCELLGLSAWEGLGPAELARVLGCSTNAAKIRTHRARRRLRRELAALDQKPIGSNGHEFAEPGASALPAKPGETQ